MYYDNDIDVRTAFKANTDPRGNIEKAHLFSAETLDEISEAMRTNEVAIKAGPCAFKSLDHYLSAIDPEYEVLKMAEDVMGAGKVREYAKIAGGKPESLAAAYYLHYSRAPIRKEITYPEPEFTME